MEASMSILYDNENILMQNWFRITDDPTNFKVGYVFLATANNCKDQY